MADAVFVEASATLQAASEVSDVGQCLDALASVASWHEASLHLLLEQIIDRRLAEPSIRSYLFDASLVDDAVQETVVAVAVGIGSFRGDAGFLTWLDRVARNEARALVRKRQRLSEPVTNAVPETHGWAQRLSSLVASEWTIDQALAQLDAPYREIIALREQEELSYQQIAERLGLPLNTVRTRLRRGRQQLASLLMSSGSDSL